MRILNLLLSVGLMVSFTGFAKATALNPKAPKGGTVNLNLDGEPPTIHPIMATDVSSQRIHDWMGETLAYHNMETWEYEPRLAEKWEISKDNKTFTFHLRQGVKFHDNTEVTAEDVKFTFDAIFEPKYQAVHMTPYYENIEKAEVIDKYTVKFTAKEVYFKNFSSLCDLEVIPKHIYSDVEKSKKMTREYIGAGPYKLDKFERGQVISIVRFQPWAETIGKAYPGMYNFERINFHSYKEETVQLERMKKGDLDYLEVRSEAYAKKMEGDPWGKTVLKKKVKNKGPMGYSFIGWNFRRDIFQDRDTRVALAHLLNREEIMKKFMYGLSSPVRGPSYNTSDYASPKVKAIPFDPKKAQQLLAKAGWKDTEKTGVLQKMINGKKVEFRFALIYPNKDTERYWTIYKEDLKRAGIDMELKYMEWNSFLKLLDEGGFDAAALSWGGGDLDWEPKQIWHSSSAVPGGSNFVYYKNPEVDKLIDQSKTIMDRTKRIALLRKVYEMIAADAPYAFFSNLDYTLYGITSKIQQPAETFQYRVGLPAWWVAP